jgi:hypothetical protein
MNEDHARPRREETAFGASVDASLEARILRTAAMPPAGLRGRVLEKVGRCLAAESPAAGRAVTGSLSAADRVGGLLAAVGAASVALSLALAAPLPRMLPSPRTAGDAFVRRVIAAGIPWEDSAASQARSPSPEKPGPGPDPPGWSRPPSAGLHLSTTDAFTGDL